MEKKLNPNYHSAIKIALIYMIISMLYIIFSDRLILMILDDNISNITLSKIQSYKGLAFVVLTSLLLFGLIWREIKIQKNIIQTLEKQKNKLAELSNDREKVLHSLSERNTFIETILKNLPIGLAVNKINEGTATFMNSKFNQIYGWPQKDLTDISNFFIKIYPEKEYREKMSQRIMDDLKSGIPERMHWEDVEITTNTGEKRIVNAKNIPVFDQNLMISTVEDVTEKKKFQRDLERSKEHLQNVTDNLPGVIIRYKLNPDGSDSLTYVSQGAKKIWGILPEDALKDNQLIWNQIDKKHVRKVRRSIEESLKNRAPWNIEWKNILPDKKVKWLQGIGTPHQLTDGSTIWNSVILDVTLRKEAEAEIKRYQKSLQNLTTEISLLEEKHRKEIAANIHDHLSQSLVISKMKLGDLQKNKDLVLYHKDIESITGYISQALENSRKITYDLSPPVLYELGLIETMYWLAEKVMDENQLKVNFGTEFKAIELSESELIIIYRSIQEVINNTIKHAQAKKIDIHFKKIKNGLEICILDDGIGFDVSKLKTVSQTNTGFGLFAIKERIKNLKGTFSVVSKIGKGTEVKIYVPLIVPNMY